MGDPDYQDANIPVSDLGDDPVVADTVPPEIGLNGPKLHVWTS